MIKYLIKESEMISDRDTSEIVLLEDPYDGLTFKFGVVKFVEKDDDVILEFSYDITELPDDVKVTDKSHLDNEIYGVLTNIIEEKYK